MIKYKLIFITFFILISYCKCDLFSTKSDYTCLNDGFIVDNGTDTYCSCKNSEYIKGHHCEEYHCINYGRAFSRQDDNGNSISYGCDCPIGFRGLHCEPVECVPNTDNSIKAFHPVFRSFSILVTLNNYMLNLPDDNITSALLQLTDLQSFHDSIDTLNVFFAGDAIQTQKFPNSRNQTMKDWLDRIIGGYELFGNKEVYNLYGDDILNLIKSSSPKSSLLIITNVGLTDYDDEIKMNEILQLSIARNIEINVIVAPQYNSFQYVYYDKTFKPLIDLAEKTIGSFISPYPLLGEPYKKKVSDIIPTFGNLLSSKTVVQADNLNRCTLNAVYINLFGDNENEWEIYLSVFINDTSYTAFEPDVTSAVDSSIFSKISDAGLWKLYKMSYTKTYNSYGILIKSQYTGPCSYRVWTTSKIRETSLPHIFLGYTIAPNIDAMSALPVRNVSNTVVGHLYNLPLNTNDTIQYNFKHTSLGGIASARPCLFNLKLGSVVCEETGIYNRIILKSTYFEEVLPILCVTNDDILKFDDINPDSKYLLDNSDNDQNEKTNEILDDNNDIKICTNTHTPQNPENQKTFALLFTNYKSLSNVLSNQLLDQDPFLNVLNFYIKAYDFSSFFVMSYTNKDADLQYSSSTNANDFRTNLHDYLGNSVDDPSTKNSTNHIKPMLKAISYVKYAYSDIIIITTQDFTYNNAEFADLYEQIQNQHVKLHFIVFDVQNYGNMDYSGFYDLAARTGGTVLPTSDKADIQHFFDFYGGNNRNIPGLTYKALGNSQTVLSIYNPSNNADIGKYTLNSFTITNKNNNKYYLMASIKNLEGYTYLTINNKNYTFTFIGTDIAYCEFNSTSLSETTEISILSFLHDYYLVNVFELIPPGKDEFYVGFTSNLNEDFQENYPSYSGDKLYPVAHISEDHLADISIYVNDQQLNNGTLTERDNVTCYYNQYFDYKLPCSSPDLITYIQLNTPDASRTAIVTCYSSSPVGQCQNGGIFNGQNCSCQVGYEGETCSDIVCYNGGVVNQAKECDCSETNYEGPHCETSTFSCQKEPIQPIFSSTIETLIIAIDRTADVIESLKASIENIPNIYQQYILVTYSNNYIDTQIFNNKKYFVNYFATLTSSSAPTNDVRIPLKEALSSVKTDRSLLIWISGNRNKCGEDDKVDNELMQYIAKHNVEVRAFTKESFISTCFRSIATLGNGLPINNFDVNKIVDYINLLTPNSLVKTTEMPSHLITFDSMSYEYCPGDSFEIDIPNDYKTDSIILTINGFTYDISDQDKEIMNNIIYSISPGKNKLTLKCDNSTLFGHAYSIEALHKTRISYTFGNSHSFITSGFAMINDYDYSSMSFYIEDIDSDIKNFDDIPVVTTSRVEVDSVAEYLYEQARTTVMNCSYPFMAQLNCDGHVGSIRIKINGKTIGGDNYQRIITGYCLSDVKCSSYGRKLKKGVCGCQPWWTNTDCSTPICMNGGTPNKESCQCSESYFGENCELYADPTFNFLPLVDNRNILILLDVFETSEDLSFSDKQNLTIDFLNTYDGNANFAFATNDGNDNSWISLTTDTNSVIAAVQNQVITNDTKLFNLSHALNFFNNLDYSDDGYSLTFIFYITYQQPVITENIKSVIQELNDQNIAIYSAYYSPDPQNSPDIELLLPNMLLGGITGSWTTYDILTDFINILQGGTGMFPVPPPSTTTPKPKECVFEYIYDTIFYLDSTIDGKHLSSLKKLLSDYGNDINFDLSPEGSRASIGSTESNVIQLCFSTKEYYDDKIKTLTLGEPGNEFKLSSGIDRIYSFFINPSQGSRDVARILFLITDKTTIDKPEVVKNVTDMLKENQQIKIALINFGDGDFSAYNDIITSGLSFTLDENEDNEEFKHRLYKSICPLINNIKVIDPNFSCNAEMGDKK